MKTERRHELQSNELASRLEHWIAAVQPHSRLIGALMVGLALVGLGFTVYRSSQQASVEASWTVYSDAMRTPEPEKYLTMILREAKGEPVANWSALTLADMKLAEGNM